MKQGLYAVGFKWPDGSIGFHSFHSSEILDCSKKEALRCLEYAKKSNLSEAKEYKLYKLKLKEIE